MRVDLYAASSLLFFFAKVLYAKPKHTSGKAAGNEGVSNNNVVVCNSARWDKN